MPDDQILFENAPHINELNFRHFRGESDYVPLAKVLTDSDKADQIEREVSAEAIAKAFEHLVNCDPYKDMIIVEVAGEMVGYLAVGGERNPQQSGCITIMVTWWQAGEGWVLDSLCYVGWKTVSRKSLRITHQIRVSFTRSVSHNSRVVQLIC